MNQALITWLDEGEHRSMRIGRLDGMWVVGLIVGASEVYLSSDPHATQDAAEAHLVVKLTSEAGRVLSAKDD